MRDHRTDYNALVQDIVSGFRGIYELPQAARYLTVTLRRNVPSLHETEPIRSRRLLRWIRAGLSLPDLAGVPGKSIAITFEDLVSMRIIAILRLLGVTWPRIHRAEQWLRKTTHYERPFAVERVWTEAVEVFTQAPVGLVAASRDGQLAFAELLGLYLEPIGDMSFRRHNGVNVAETWEATEYVMMNPEVQFGQPCIKGTRIPTSSLWEMWRGGDSLHYLTQAFKLSSDQLEHALEWEDSLRAKETASPSG